MDTIYSNGALRADQLRIPLEKYFEKQLPYNIIAIDGLWGIGKTHEIISIAKMYSKVDKEMYHPLIRACKMKDNGEVVRETEKLDISYLKLFGMKDTIELYISLIASSLQSIEKDRARGLSALADIRKQLDASSFANAGIVALKGAYKLLFANYNVRHPDVIILDNLERISQNFRMEELLAVVEFLKSCSSRVIIVLNEKQMSKEHHKFYSLYRDKIIDHTFKVCNLSKYFMADYTNLEGESYNYRKYDAGFLECIIKDTGVTNGRTIMKAHNFFIDMYTNLKELKIEDTATIRQLMWACYLIVIVHENIPDKLEDIQNKEDHTFRVRARLSQLAKKAYKESISETEELNQYGTYKDHWALSFENFSSLVMILLNDIIDNRHRNSPCYMPEDIIKKILPIVLEYFYSNSEIDMANAEAIFGHKFTYNKYNKLLTTDLFYLSEESALRVINEREAWLSGFNYENFNTLSIFKFSKIIKTLDENLYFKKIFRRPGAELEQSIHLADTIIDIASRWHLLNPSTYDSRWVDSYRVDMGEIDFKTEYLVTKIKGFSNFSVMMVEYFDILKDIMDKDFEDTNGYMIAYRRLSTYFDTNVSTVQNDLSEGKFSDLYLNDRFLLFGNITDYQYMCWKAIVDIYEKAGMIAKVEAHVDKKLEMHKSDAMFVFRMFPYASSAYKSKYIKIQK